MLLENGVELSDSLPYVLAEDGILVAVSERFLQFTGFREEEVIGRESDFLFHNMLRLTADPRMSNDRKCETYLFTRNYSVKLVDAEANYCGKQIAFIFKKKFSLGHSYQYTSQLCEDNALGIGILSVPDFALLAASDKFIRFFNPPYNERDNCIGRFVCEFVEGWDGSPFEKACLEAIREGRTSSFSEQPTFCFSHRNTYWDAVVTPVQFRAMRKYLVVQATDVTERVKNRKKIQEQAEFLKIRNEEQRAMIESLSDGLFMLDQAGRFSFLNQAGRDFFFQPEKMKKKGDSFAFAKYFDMDGRELSMQEMVGNRVLQGETVKQLRVRVERPDGIMYFSLSGSPILGSEGNVKSAIVCCREITELVKQENFIKLQKLQMESAIRNLSDSILVFDANMKPVMYNDASTRLIAKLGIDSIKWAEMLNWLEFSDESGKLILIEDLPFYRLLKKETVSPTIVTVKNRSQKTAPMHLSISGSPILDNMGNFLWGILCTQDVTEFMEGKFTVFRAEREKNEVLQKAIEMKDEFLSLISHEFKTPLTVINSAVQAMETLCRNELSDRARGFLSKIRQNSFRQLRLVNNLLDITRINAGKIKINKRNMDIVFLTKSITESVYLYASQKGIKLNFVSSFQAKIIGIDEEKYERILLNLLSNAIKFTPSGKWIIVSLRTRRGFVCIEVKDNGVGIPEDKLELIFERFGQVDNSLTRQAEGTGIGLSLVRLFVEALGGTICVKSKVGKGTVFTVLLPMERAMEESTEKETSEITDDRLVRATSIELSDIYF